MTDIKCSCGKTTKNQFDRYIHFIELGHKAIGKLKYDKKTHSWK